MSNKDTNGSKSSPLLNGVVQQGPKGTSDVAADEPPEAVRELAASCKRFVHAKYGVSLDGTSNTLSLLDQYIRDARPEIIEKPESIPLLEATIGAYLGEVIRNVFAGLWITEGGYDAWRLCMTRVYLSFNPIGMIKEALTLESADGWHAHLDVEEEHRTELEQRLEALPEVDADEYYAPSTRFDVVAIAVDTLYGRQQAQGLGDVRFDANDYRRAPY